MRELISHKSVRELSSLPTVLPVNLFNVAAELSQQPVAKKKATLIDVFPPGDDSEVKLIASEIKRVIDFAGAASNQAAVINKLVQALTYYGLTYSDML
jgi:hypothetical protein